MTSPSRALSCVPDHGKGVRLVASNVFHAVKRHIRGSFLHTEWGHARRHWAPDLYQSSVDLPDLTVIRSDKLSQRLISPALLQTQPG